MNSYERELREMDYPRVSPGKLAREIIGNIGEDNPAFFPDDPLSEFIRANGKYSTKDAVRLYQEGKKERYACIGSIDNSVISIAIEGIRSFPPFGLIIKDLNSDYKIIEDSELRVLKKFDARDPYRQLTMAMLGTLHAYYALEMDSILAGDRGQGLYLAAQRLAMWQIAYDRVPKNKHEWNGMTEGNTRLQPPFSRENFIGSGTGINHSSAIVAVIPQVLKRDLPGKVCPETMFKAAKANFHLLASIATLGHDTSSAILDTLYGVGGEIKQRKLETIDLKVTGFNEGIARIDYTPIVWKRALDLMKKRKIELTGWEQTAGCPAMIKIGSDPSAAEKLWNWFAGIADYIYKTREINN